jgi:hypothetical protein
VQVTTTNGEGGDNRTEARHRLFAAIDELNSAISALADEGLFVVIASEGKPHQRVPHCPLLTARIWMTYP